MILNTFSALILTVLVPAQQRVTLNGQSTNFFLDSSRVIHEVTSAGGEIYFLVQMDQFGSLGMAFSAPDEYVTNTQRNQWAVWLAVYDWSFLGTPTGSADCQRSLRVAYENGPWPHEVVRPGLAHPQWSTTHSSSWTGSPGTPQAVVTGLPSVHMPALGNFPVRLTPHDWLGNPYPNPCPISPGTWVLIRGQVVIAATGY